MKKLFLLIFVSCIFGIVQDNFAQAIPADEEINLAEVKIEMKRDGSSIGCFSCSTDYLVSIDGNGIVNYEDYSGVKLKGNYIFSLPVEQVKDLIKDFRKINFFSLDNNYTERKLANGVSERISHAVKTTITLTLGDKKKSVFNFYGAPKELDELQNKINDIVIKLQQND